LTTKETFSGGEGFSFTFTSLPKKEKQQNEGKAGRRKELTGKYIDNIKEER